MSAQTRNVHLWTSQQGKLPNQMHWKTFLGDGNKKVCEICDYYAVLDDCVARKQVQFDPVTNAALVLSSRGFPQKGKEESCGQNVQMIGLGKIKEAQAEAYNWTNPRFA